MGKNKKSVKLNVFKVVGAKSLKKSKPKTINLGLKHIKKQVDEVDKQYLEIQKQKNNKSVAKSNESKIIEKRPEKTPTTKKDVAETAEQMVKMDL